MRRTLILIGGDEERVGRGDREAIWRTMVARATINVAVRLLARQVPAPCKLKMSFCNRSGTIHRSPSGGGGADGAWECGAPSGQA